MTARIMTAGVVLVLVTAGDARAMTVQQQQDFSKPGATMSFSFTNLPPPTNNDVTVTVELLGDYTGSNRYAEVKVESKQQDNHTGGSGCSTTPDSKDYVLGKSVVQNGTLTVVVTNSSAVTASCTTPNRVLVRVSYEAKPDLLPINVTAPQTGSTSHAGDSFTVRFGVRCWHEPVTTDFNVQIQHCPQQNAYACVPLGDKPVTDDFSPADIKVFDSPALSVPDTAAHGASYVQITVDSTTKVSESVETNNVAYAEITVTTKPDLSPSAATVPSAGSTAEPGSQFIASYTVSNKASTSAVTQSFVMAYSYCTAEDKSTCTPLLQQTVTGDIASGADYTFSSPTLTIPVGATVGPAYVHVAVDSAAAVDESDETNNERFDPITVTGVPDDAGPLPDMGADGPVPDLLPPSMDGGWQWPDVGHDVGPPDQALDGGGKSGDSEGCGCVVGDRGAGSGHALLLLLLLLLGAALFRR